MISNLILTIVIVFGIEWAKSRFLRKRIRRELYTAIMVGPMDKLNERLDKVLTKYYGPDKNFNRGVKNEKSSNPNRSNRDPGS